MALDLLRQKEHDQGWNDRARKEVRREEREDDGLSQRYKQITRHARQEEHRHKDDADADCGDECGNSDLLGAIEYGLT